MESTMVGGASFIASVPASPVSIVIAGSHLAGGRVLQTEAVAQLTHLVLDQAPVIPQAEGKIGASHDPRNLFGLGDQVLGCVLGGSVSEVPALFERPRVLGEAIHGGV
jgi:hypothetical protein